MANSWDTCRTTIDLPILVRPCTAEDVPALEWFGMFSDHQAIIQATFRRHERGESTILVADANGFPVGQVWIDFAEDREPPTGFLWAVRVLPPLRRIGIGASLMASAERVVRGRDMSTVELTVEPHNRAALRFYERLGYRVVGTERNGQHSGPEGTGTGIPFDLWVMRKSLKDQTACGRPHRAGASG